MTTTIADAGVHYEVSQSGTSHSDYHKETVSREVVPTPDRYRNALGKFRISRSARCNACGRCAEACAYGVHSKPDIYSMTLRPQDYRCIGSVCAKSGNSCISQCPQKALTLYLNPNIECLGDARWSSDLILSTWHQAETGHTPPPHLEYRHGASGGGFDRIRFRFEAPELAGAIQPQAERRMKDEIGIDTGLDLNRRNDGRPQVHIDIPVYGGGMSFGSVSIHTILAKARAAAAWNTFSCTGEGGYPDRLKPYDAHMITQVATGLFGVREETIQRVRMVEFKYAQGAKPGL
ncbi:MAG TPA: glutamate synthase-related protein, partial [Acidobacteriota bacterium]|nr:glutamate synthase-related protein [Acidobacteriota bacterium]